MPSSITLSAGVRQNLLALQSTASLLSSTQNRLATGKRVNSALDNPTNFFTSSALSSRAGDLTTLLDQMANGISTVKTADNGLTAINTTVETMKATITQARQDASWRTTSYTNAPTTTVGTEVISITGGTVGSTPVNVEVVGAQGVSTSAGNYANMDFNNAGVFGSNLSFTVAVNGGTARSIVISSTSDTNLTVSVDGGTATNFTVVDGDAVTKAEMVGALNAGFSAATTPVPITVSAPGAPLVFTSNTQAAFSAAVVTVSVPVASGAPVVAASFGFTAAPVLTKINNSALNIDTLVANINANSSLIGRVKASNDGGKLNLQNFSVDDLSIIGATSTGTITGGVGAANTTAISGNTVRRGLVTQFNDLRTQLDKLADDASFNGVNLLKGDTLKLIFNEINTSSISIVSQNAAGINTTVLGIGAATTAEFSSNTQLDKRLDALGTALTQLRSQASSFGSNLSIVQNRQEFTKAMINTLQTGADGLVLADSNEEAANLLALQTRQQLSTTALSLASQADQAVLRLF